MYRRELHGDGWVLGNDAAAAVLPLPLELLGGAEKSDGRLHLGVVESFVWRGKGRHGVEREVHLKIASAVVDAGKAIPDVGRHLVRVDHLGDRVVGCDARHHDGRVDRRAVLESDADHVAVGDQDFVDLAAKSRLAAVALQDIGEMCCQSANSAAELLHQRGVLVGHGQPERQRRGTAGDGRPAVGGVDGEEGQHSA